jgi:hypothetical protein
MSGLSGLSYFNIGLIGGGIFFGAWIIYSRIRR